MPPKNSPEKKKMGPITLNVACRYSNLETVRNRVMEECLKAGLNEDQAAELEMAVDEACTNVIEHSYGGESPPDGKPPQHDLRINFQHYEDRIEIEIYDNGVGFDYSQRKEIPPQQWLDDKRERGLGLYIIKNFVDDVTYERGTRSGNFMRLTKRV